VFEDDECILVASGEESGQLRYDDLSITHEPSIGP
jgi:hypothetical protein